MNRKILRRITAVITTLACLLIFPAAALATELDVTADSTSVTEGDTITVTITVSAPNITVADGVFTYDPAILSYISSNGGASDGYINLVSVQQGGSSSLTAVVKFSAIGEGEAVINVNLESILDYDGSEMGDAEAKVSITVASSGEPGTDGEIAPPVDYSLAGVKAQNVIGTEEPMYIWRSLRSISLPSGFTDMQVTYKGEFVGGASIPDSEDIVLLYLSEASGENNGYYIYDSQNDVLFPYLTVLSVSATFTVIWPDDSTAIPEGFKEAALELGGKSVPAWAAPDSDGTVFLIYVRSSSGEKDFYMYNVPDKSLQRYKAFAEAEPEPEPNIEPTSEPTSKPIISPVDDDASGISITPSLLIAAAAAFLLLAAAAVVFAVLYIKSVANLKKQDKPKKEEKSSIKIKDAEL